ncbi:hypothetical protein GH714_008585 [Hevea brasiliensis]|uniref:TF-B3 domain-containing protein n=1 Tax=Hevea brasiliensis TaxID=3981 RepID=A0A6A6LT91_HEVBR|nr:hypothetical protein GH714_008585 [Hevea brasiliensis]
MPAGIMPPSKPHFFKPVLPGFERKLSIPVSFFKYLKGQKCEKAVLRSIAGKLWYVKVNGCRFEDGWEEFVRDHDLHVGDFLVFRHEGDMVFDVMVFDPSACQREYLSFDVKEEIETPEAEEVAKESDLGDLTKNKQVKTTFKGKAVSSVLERPYFVVNVSFYSARNSRIVTHQIYNFKQNVPRKFARANGLKNRRCKIVLMDQEGRSWPAELGYKKSDGQVYIGQGWNAFRNANDLHAGDSFLLELIKNGRKPILKMYRNPNKTKKEVTDHTTKAGSFSSRLPHFYVTMKTTHLKKRQLKIPRNFARRNGLCRKCFKMILTNEKGSSWVVSAGKCTSGDAFIGRGWIAFAKENGLREGDVFLLELVKGERSL